jgi:GTPase SAR1 family protein
MNNRISMNEKDSLKVVVLGNEGVGKTTLIQQLINNNNNNVAEKGRSTSDYGEFSPCCSTMKSLDPMFNCSSSGATDPTVSTEESSYSYYSAMGDSSSARTSNDPLVALNMYEWQLHNEHISRDGGLKNLTIWDFSGHEQLHSVQEMFFTPETLYVVVWDMAAQDIQPASQERCCGDGFSGYGVSSSCPPPKPIRSSFASQTRSTSSCSTAFRLDYDSDTDSENECELDLYNQEEIRRLKRALDHDIDIKVQVWIDRIQTLVPGATILPVATFADRFLALYDCKEAKKRCKSLKERLLCHENCRYQDLKWRIESAASSQEGGHKQACRWVHSLARRPRILFGSPQDDGNLLPHQVCAKDGMGMTCFRDYVISSARDLADRSQCLSPVCSLSTRSNLRETCRSMRNHFKVVQAHYLLMQYENDSQQEIPAALESLHLSGELFYFRCMGAESNADLVFLDPTWLVESVNFILQNRYILSTSSSVCDSREAACRSFEQEIKIRWKNRPTTMMGLELAEQLSVGAPDRVFDLFTALMAQHDILVPLALCNGNINMFIPSLLSRRDFHEGRDCNDVVNCPLLHFGTANFFGSSMCYGLTFMERIPSTLMERISVHIIKIFQKNGVLDTCIKEFRCWKDSWRMNLSICNDNEDSSMEMESFLLHAPESDDAPCHTVSCRSMCVTCIRVFPAISLGNSAKMVCMSIRRAIQNALDEMPGVDYKDEGICPECLKKKSIGEIGTWTFPKIKSIVDDQESTIRCRNGHTVEIGLVKGLIACHLETPKPDFSCCTPVEDVLSIDKSASSTSSTESESVPSDESVGSSLPLGEDFGKTIPYEDLSKMVPSAVEISLPAVTGMAPSSVTISVDRSTNDDDRAKIQEVKKVIRTYECSTKKRFFGMRKAKLVLSGLQLRENHLPMPDFIDTPVGHSIQYLALSNNLFETIPASLVVCLPNLKSLDLSNCCVSELPEKWDTPKLKKLNLSYNRLRTFPRDEMLFGMLELEELNLKGNKLTKVNIPSDSHLLHKLKTLDVSMNQISSVPKDLGKLASLKVFDIHQNPIKEVPVDIVSQMNSFFSDAANDTPKKGILPCRSDLQQQKRSMWSSKGSSSGDDRSSFEPLKRDSRLPGMRQVSLARSTHITVPMEDNSEQCEYSVY